MNITKKSVKVEKVVEVTEKQVILTLTSQEADDLKYIVGSNVSLLRTLQEVKGFDTNRFNELNRLLIAIYDGI